MHPNKRCTERESVSALEHPAQNCRAVVEPMESGVELCTIYSVASDEMQVTMWISATEGSFCTLEDAR